MHQHFMAHVLKLYLERDYARIPVDSYKLSIIVLKVRSMALPI